jgi:hypothetical protein
MNANERARDDIEVDMSNRCEFQPANMGIHLDNAEVFAYDKSWDDIESMLDKAERKLNYHRMEMEKFKPKSKKWMEHARNFKALQGVVKTLRWTLGDKRIAHPLE